MIFALLGIVQTSLTLLSLIAKINQKARYTILCTLSEFVSVEVGADVEGEV